MKTTLTKTALIAMLFGITLGAKAQTTTDGIKLSIGLESGLGLGNFKDTHKTSIGGSLQADIPVAPGFYANVNGGYADYLGKDNVLGTGFSAPDIHILPALAGLKYYPVSNFYFQADAGAAFALNKSDAGYTNKTAFLYAPQVGYQFITGGKSFLDAGIRYEGTTSFNGDSAHGKINQVGLRIAYGFGL